jgi:squalene synthase HpnC
MDSAVSSLETPSGKNKDTENFPVGSFLIRADLRPHVHSFYRFARAADDIADNPLLEPSEKLRRLNRFDEALMNPVDTTIPAVTALRESLKVSGVTPQHSRDLLRAFKQDATKLRYKNWAELMDYCRYSASPVGRHVLALHEVGEEAWPANDALCSALQIINHMQDCGDDYRELDRVYLPEEDMAAFGAQISELGAEKLTLAMRKVLNKQIERMKPMLSTARDLPRFVPDTRLKMETAIIHELAQNLIKHLAACDPLKDNAKLSPVGVLMSAVFGAMKAWS